MRRLDRETRNTLVLLGGIAILGLGILVTCTPVGELLAADAFQLAYNLGDFALGPVRFVRDNFPSADGVVLGTASALLLLGCLHWFGLRSAGTPGQSVGGSDPESVWTLGQTLSTGTTLLLTCAIMLGSIGFVRHVAWLATSDRVWKVVHGPSPRAVSKSQLRQVGLALHFHHDSAGSLPPGTTFDAASGRALHGWIAPLLPYFDQQKLHERIDWARAWDEGDNAEVCRIPLEVLFAPAALVEDEDLFDERRFPVTHYAANAWILGGDRRVSFRHVTDGASNTLLIGEAAVQPKAWGHPRNWRDPALGLDTSPHGFGMPGVDVVQFTLVDGAVIALSKKTDPRVLRALATPRGGDDATLPP